MADVRKVLLEEMRKIDREIEGLQRERTRIAKAIDVLSPAPGATKAPRARRKRTPEQRKAQSERMRAYWAKKKAAD